MSHARSVLVLGGQRSGKSRTAEGIAEASGLRPVYVATATAGDGEMGERIARHRARRGAAWRLIEEPLDLPTVLAGNDRPDTVMLVDCLTLWLTNLLGCGRPSAPETDRLVDCLARIEGRVVLVSSEVGSGIIPHNVLARKFADDLGVLNQRVAAAVDEVVLVAAGLPLFLKRMEG